MNHPSTSRCLFPIAPRKKFRGLRALSLGLALLAGGGVAAAAGSRAAWAQSLGSTSSVIPAWARGQVIGLVPLQPGDKAIALTFDDGPQPGAANTDGVLSALASLNVRGTFFMMGSMVQANPALARRVRDAGHAIGNHTWSHQAAPPDPTGEVLNTDAIIQSTLGMSTALFRPPYGNMTNGVAGAARAQGDACVVWSVDPHDFDMPSADTIVSRVLAGAAPGAIVLMHDAGGDRSQTIAALPQIVNTLRAQGYRFVTVPELLDLRDAGTTTTSTAPAPAVGDGLSATYYSRLDFSGTTASRVDPRVAFDWGRHSQPAAGIGTDTFSARWTGQVVAPTSGTYTFILAADDGMRLWVDGRLILDYWRNKAGERSATIAMTAGRRTDIRIEYFENSGAADITLSWSGPGVARQVIPQSALFSRASTPTPSAAPSITLATPQVQWTYKSLAAANGTATNNGAGLLGVGGLLFRYSDARYWNGGVWVSAPEGSESPASTSGTPTVPGGSTYAWNYAMPPLIDGRYAVRAVARDRAGGWALLPWTQFYVDTTPPRVAIDLTPGVYRDVRTLYGSASDIGPGISGVGLSLMRVSDSAFWDGSIWRSGSVELPVYAFPVIGADSTLSLGWTFSMPLMAPGTYSLKAVARDYVGNAATSSEVRFTIDPLAPAQLVGSASSRPASILSTGDASAPSTIRVRFKTPLHPRSLALPHYQVLVNGLAVAPSSSRYDSATGTVTLSVPGALKSGDRVGVAWSSLLAPNGRSLADGQWLGTVH